MDKRKQQSQKRIQAAFLQLLDEKSYGEITIQDILEQAGVSRSAFYANFSGKDELLALQVKAMCGHILDGTPQDTTVSTESLLTETETILNNILESSAGMRALIAGEGSERFADCLRHAIVERASAIVPQVPNGAASRMNRSFLLHHIASSFVGMVRWWAWNGFAATPHNLAQDYLSAILAIFKNE